MIKNLEKSTVIKLKDQVPYLAGQVVSKTLAQNDSLSLTVFSVDKGEEISTHQSGGDAMVTVLEGTGRFTIDGEPHSLKKAKPSSCRPNILMRWTVKSASKCF